MYQGELCLEVMHISLVIEISLKYSVQYTEEIYVRSQGSQVALQRINGSMLLLKTGSDTCDHVRRYGYALRGVTPTMHRFVYSK